MFSFKCFPKPFALTIVVISQAKEPMRPKLTHSIMPEIFLEELLGSPIDPHRSGVLIRQRLLAILILKDVLFLAS